MPPVGGPETSNAQGHIVTVAYRQLQKKYERDHEAIRSTWRATPPAKRRAMVLESVLGGTKWFPENELDRRTGAFNYITPELNVRNLVTGDNLINLIRDRATTPINDIHYEDMELIRSVSHNYNLKRRSASTRFYKFIDEEDWGLLIETTPLTTPKVLETLREMGNGVCFVEEGIGKLLLDRQSTIYMHLQVLLDDIMELKRQLENPDAVAPKRKMIGECISEDLKTLGISNAHSPGLPSVSTSTYTVSELAELANEQYDAVDDHVHLLRHEPQYLAEIAKQYYYSSPEFVVDEKGQHDFVIMHNAYNNRVVKRAFRDAYEARTTWKSITVLIAAIDKDTTKHPGNVVTKELWSLCCMELTRACAVFKQMLLADHKMERYFVRKGAFVTLKIPIEVIERKNAYQGLLIRIACTKPPDTDIAKYLKEIYEFDKRSLGFRENISERAGPAFGDIEVITAFMARLRRVISLPKQATSNVFVKAIKEHVLHLESAIEQVNLDDFVAPLDNLKEPLAAQGCIDFLDNACIQSSYAFHETVGIALAQVLERLEDDDAKILARRLQRQEPTPFVSFEENKRPTNVAASAPLAETQLEKPTTLNESITRPRNSASLLVGCKTKTRGCISAEHIILTTDSVTSQHIKPASEEKISLPASIAKTFKKIFNSRTGIPWSGFLSGMSSLGFSAEAIGGSAVRFRSEKWGSMNIHRPHPGDRIEGFAAMKLRGRLERRFGWGVETFVSDKSEGSVPAKESNSNRKRKGKGKKR